ncbi:MAG: hypothetical protein H0U56_15680 [Methylibium sp.]|nr:hypothetical protein [Methylibium sp.]
MADLGLDFLGILDLDADLTTGTGKLALIHAVARRLTTTTGQMLDDPSYGYNLQLLTNSVVQPERVAERVRVQCLEEERVSEEGTTVTVSYEAGTKTLTVDIVLGTDDGATYAFTLNVTAVTAEILLAA